MALSEFFNLSERTAVVTGAAQGIGRAIALLLAEAGANLVLADIKEAGMEKTLSEIRSMKRNGIAVKCDVRRTADAEHLINESISKFGGLDILVNNAGIFGKYGDILNVSFDEWNRILDVDLTGAFWLSKLAAQSMMQLGGSIINISSIVALGPHPGAVHYAAAKAGLVSVTKSLAFGCGKYGIRVNAIAPGYIETPSSTSLYTPEVREKRREQVALKRTGKPEDVARVVVFLASDASSYITGTVIEVSGGFYGLIVR